MILMSKADCCVTMINGNHVFTAVNDNSIGGLRIYGDLDQNRREGAQTLGLYSTERRMKNVFSEFSE